MSDDVDLVAEYIGRALDGEYNDAIGNRMVGQPRPGPDGRRRQNYAPVEMQARQLAAALDYSADRFEDAFETASQKVVAAPTTAAASSTSSWVGSWARASDHDAPEIYAKWTGGDPADRAAAAQNWQRFRHSVITALHTRTRQLIDEHESIGSAFQQFDVVIMRHGVPEEGVEPGTRGVVVAVHLGTPEAYEVEVVDDQTGATVWAGAVPANGLQRAQR